MKPCLPSRLVLLAVLLTFVAQSPAFISPERTPLPNFDKRGEGSPPGDAVSAEQRVAVEQLRAALPAAKVDFDPVTGAPKLVSARESFLSGPNGVGNAILPAAAAGFAGDTNGATKAFLRGYSAMFGYGPEILGPARVKREFVTPHNGMRTVVGSSSWQACPFLRLC